MKSKSSLFVLSALVVMALGALKTLIVRRKPGDC